MKNKKDQGWYRFKNLNDGKVEIFIYDVIVDYKWDEDETTAKGFIDDLQAAGAKTPIDLHINSPGGSVFAGLAIFNAIRRHQGNVDVFIDGLAASIASVVAMAGDTVTMPENALMMIHDPYALAMGSGDELRKAAESLDKAKAGLISAYRFKTAMADEDISALMSAETWMTAAEAFDYGFIDQYEEALPMAALSRAAAFDLSRYAKVPPEAFKNFQGIKDKTINHPAAAQAKPRKQGETIMDLETLKSEHKDIYDAVYAAGKQAGREEGMKAGAETERNRIKAVEDQLMPGHEALIAGLKYDGETSGEQTAVKVLAAEKALLANKAAAMKDDAVEPVDPAVPGDVADQEKQVVIAAMAKGLNKAK